MEQGGVVTPLAGRGRIPLLGEGGRPYRGKGEVALLHHYEVWGRKVLR